MIKNIIIKSSKLNEVLLSSKSSVEIMRNILGLQEILIEFRKTLAPPSIKEMVRETQRWLDSSSERDIAEFLTTNFENLVVFHNTLGARIRDRFLLWGFHWEPEIVDNIDISPAHPDALSMRVIEELWRNNQDD